MIFIGNLCETQLGNRCTGASPADIRKNDYFQHPQPDKIYFIVFNFADIIRGAEVVLLTHNFPGRATTVGGPPQKEFLRALLLIFVKHYMNMLDPQRLVKQQADCLLTGL